MRRPLAQWLSALAVVCLLAQPWLAAAGGVGSGGISPELQRLFADLGVICHPGNEASAPGEDTTGPGSDSQAHHQMCAQCLVTAVGVARLPSPARPPLCCVLGAGRPFHSETSPAISAVWSLGPRGPPV